MAARFWVGGAGTWDGVDLTHISATSGGAGGASNPGSGDTMTFDGSSGGGTVTVTYAVDVTSITMGAFTGTLDFGSSSPTMQAFLNSGTGTRTLVQGSGTWSITGNAITVWDWTVLTNFTFTKGTNPIRFTYSGSTGTRTIVSSSNAGAGALSAHPDISITAGTDIIGLTNSRVGHLVFTGFSGTLAIGTRLIYGNLTVTAGMSWTAGTSITTFGGTSGTQVITTNGNTMATPFVVDGVGGTVQLADNWNISTTSTCTITLTNGTFNTNTKSITCAGILSSNSNTRVLTITSSTITIGSTGNNATVWNIATSTGMTLNSTSSVINITGNALSFSGGGLSYGSVTLNAQAGGNTQVVGANTFVNLTLTNVNLNDTLTVQGNTTVSTLFTVTGNSSVNRLWLKSTTNGTPVTITAAAVALTNVDFSDIVGAGAATWSGTSLGNAQGNSNITFTAPVTLYWIANGGSARLTSHWSLSSGGAATTTTPLPHDTCIFDANSITLAGQTITWDITRLGTVNMDAVLNTPTLNMSVASSYRYYGSLALGVGVTYTGARSVIFHGRSAYTIKSNGVTYPLDVQIDAPGGTYSLADAISIPNTLTVTNGGFDAVTYNVTATLFSSSNTNTRSVNMGPGIWTLTNTGLVWNTNTGTGLTLNAGTSTVIVSDTSSSTKSMTQGSQILYAVTVIGGGGGTMTFGSNFRVTNFNCNPTSATTLKFANAGNAITVTGDWNVNGIAGTLLVITSTSAGNQFTFTKASGLVTSRYVSIKDSVATGGASFQAVNSTDAGNNTGWVFSTASAGGGLQAGKKFAAFGGARPINKVLDSKLHGYRKLGG